MFEKVFRQLLLGYIGRYIKDIPIDQLKIDIWKGILSFSPFYIYFYFTWFFLWTKQYYILGYFFGIFGTYWHLHLHQHKRPSPSGVNEFSLDYMATGSSMWGQLLVGFISQRREFRGLFFRKKVVYFIKREKNIGPCQG